MKKILLLSIFTLLYSTFAFAGTKSEEDVKARKTVLDAIKNNSSALGQQFVVAFPPNYDPNYTTQALDIYVASGQDTEVCIKNDYFTLERCLPVEAGTITTFTTQNETSSWAWELWESERPLEFGFEVTADAPISVYVMVSKRATSEGYMAIPVDSWGKKYIHNNYYHWNQFSWSFSSGFVIIANESDTKVTINYQGKGQGYGQTSKKGIGIGEVDRISLEKHQVYMVLTESNLTAGFDISGTVITSNKDIGVISFHQISWIPSSVGAGDNIVSMMPPIETWGKEYATIELDRGTDKGDYVRVLAAEDNTKVQINSFDIATKELLYSWDVTLQQGEIWDHNGQNVSGHCADPNVKGMTGSSTYKADKPIYVQQYSYSSQWDCVPGGLWDPFTFPITAREQYTNETIFQTPYNKSSDNEFNNNYFNIVVIGDTSDTENHRRMMNSIVLDGQKMTSIDASFGIRQIPGTDYFWGRFPVQNGPHFIKADEDTRFGAYIYGFSWFDSYAWPAATNYDNLTEVDTLKPVLEISEVNDECGVFRIHATELRNGLAGDDPLQVDKGFNKGPQELAMVNFLPPVLIDKNGNEIDMENFPIPGVYDYWWEFRVADVRSDASYEGYFVDKSRDANFEEFELEYSADALAIDPEEHDFGDVKVNVTSPTETFIVTVESDELTDIESIELLYNNVFSIVSGETAPANMVNGDQHSIGINYTPTKPFEDTEYGFDVDTLIIKTACSDFTAIVRGRGVASSLVISDFLNNTIRPGGQICTDEKATGNIKITNFGTNSIDDLGIIKVENIITGATLLDVTNDNAVTDWDAINALIPEFDVVTDGILPLPFDQMIIPASTDDNGTDLIIAKVCFQTNNLDQFRYEITFKSSTTEGDHVSVWDGNVIDAALDFNDLVWAPMRVGTVNTDNTNLQPDEVNRGMVTITNTGNTPIDVVRVEVLDANNDPTNEFEIDMVRNAALAVNNQIVGKPAGMSLCPLTVPDCQGGDTDALIVPITFTPQVPAKATISAKLSIVFLDGEGQEQTASADLAGASFLPALEPTVDGIFQNAVFVGESSNEEKTVTLRSVGDFADLAITSIELGDPTSPIQPVTDLATYANTTIANATPLVIGFGFDPVAEGDFVQNLIITHDGAEGTEQIRVPVVVTNSDDLTASTMSYSAVADDIDFGNVSQCVNTNPSQPVSLTNDGQAGDAPLEFVSIQFIDPTMDAYFTFTAPAAGTVVDPETALDIPVTFKADVAPVGVQFDALYIINYTATDEAGNTLADITEQRTISGSTFGYEIEFSVDSPNTSIVPGDRIYGNPSGAKDDDANSDVWVATTNAGQGNIWADNDITEVTVTLLYDPIELASIATIQIDEELANIIPANSIIAGWELLEISSQQNITNPDMDELVLVFDGINKITQDGLIFSMPFQALIHDDLAAQVTLVSVDLGNICSDESDEGNEISDITLEYCESSQRAVTFDPNAIPTSFSPVSPNPINADVFEVDYSIGYGGHVTMEISTIDGKVIDVPVNQVMEGGQHRAIIATSQLPSGQHFLTLKATGKTITQPIVIVK